MSSKFRDLLTQARNRPAEEEEGGAEPTDTRESESDVPEPEAEPLPETEGADDSSIVGDYSGASRGRPRNGKRSNPLFTQITAYISKRTHQEVKVALLHEGQSRQISELVEECLRAWLANQK